MFLVEGGEFGWPAFGGGFAGEEAAEVGEEVAEVLVKFQVVSVEVLSAYGYGQGFYEVVEEADFGLVFGAVADAGGDVLDLVEGEVGGLVTAVQGGDFEDLAEVGGFVFCEVMVVVAGGGLDFFFVLLKVPE